MKKICVFMGCDSAVEVKMSDDWHAKYKLPYEGSPYTLNQVTCDETNQTLSFIYLMNSGEELRPTYAPMTMTQVPLTGPRLLEALYPTLPTLAFHLQKFFAENNEALIDILSVYQKAKKGFASPTDTDDHPAQPFGTFFAKGAITQMFQKVLLKIFKNENFESILLALQDFFEKNSSVFHEHTKGEAPFFISLVPEEFWSTCHRIGFQILAEEDNRRPLPIKVILQHHSFPIQYAPSHPFSFAPLVISLQPFYKDKDYGVPISCVTADYLKYAGEYAMCKFEVM